MNDLHKTPEKSDVQQQQYETLKWYIKLMLKMLVQN